MATSSNEHITDVNERRKAQNRVAQKNYRARQRMRMKLAEAVLLDMPLIQNAVSQVGQNRDQAWIHAASEMDDQNGAFSCLMSRESSFRGSGHDERLAHVQAINPTNLSVASTASHTSQRSTTRRDAHEYTPASFLPTPTADPMSSPPEGHSANGSTIPRDAYPGERTMMEPDCIDSSLGHDDWITSGDYHSPSQAFLPMSLPPTSSTMPHESERRPNLSAGSPRRPNTIPSTRQASPSYMLHDADRSQDCGSMQTQSLRSPPSFSSLMNMTSHESPSTLAAPSSSSSMPGLSSMSPSPSSLGVIGPLTPSGSTTSTTRRPGVEVAVRQSNDVFHHRPSISMHMTDDKDDNTVADRPEASHHKDPEVAASPLLTAISLGNIEIARLLVRSGARVDDPDSTGKTALFRAVENGDTQVAMALLDLGADVFVRDSTGSGMLHTAIRRDNLDMVRMLLGWCQDSESRDGQRGGGSLSPPSPSPLVQRCINAQDGKKMTAVYLCVVMQRVEILKVLLEYGADVNIGGPRLENK